MNHWEGKLWYAYGTSMTSVKQGEYVPVVERLSGLKVVNLGIPGGCLTPDGYGKGNTKRAVMNLEDGKEKADLINMADRVVIVTNQSTAAVSATNILASNINGMNTDKYIFVCNDFDKMQSNALISPRSSLKFTISDYVDHFNLYEQMSLEELAGESSIQRVAFLII